MKSSTDSAPTSPSARNLRATALVLGILGGLAGIAAHAVLLVDFFSQSHGLVRVFVQLTLATALSLAALVTSGLCRRSVTVLAVFLPVFAVLGFLTRPLSWLPAGVLLLAAGATALLPALQEGRRRARFPSPQVYTSPEGKPLHWSEAARLGLPTQRAPLATSTGPRDTWSTGRKAAAVASVLVAAAIVIPLSLFTWDSPSPTLQAAATTALSAATASTASPAVRPNSTTTTEPSSRFTTTTAADDLLHPYVNEDFAFSMSYPSAWRNTDPEEVGGRVYGSRNQALAKMYSDAFVAAAFADWHGPTHNGCYLDFIWVEVLEGGPADPSALSEARDSIEQLIDSIDQSDSGVHLLQPIRDVRLGGAAGFKYTWLLPVDHLNVVATECLLLADDTWYYLEFAASQDDWEGCEPLFDKILQSFTVEGTSPII